MSDHEILVGSGDKHVRNYDIRMGSLGQSIFKKCFILIQQIIVMFSVYLVNYENSTFSHCTYIIFLKLISNVLVGHTPP